MAAVLVGDRSPEVVEIKDERRVPSVVVVLQGGEIVVGQAAEVLSVSHPGSALRAMKGQLGNAAPVVLDGRPYQVVTLVAAFLRAIAQEVVQQIGESPSEVRLTHPASWNGPRRQRLLEAAAKAGLHNVVLVPEPVAAAVAHAAGAGLVAGEYIAVYDLGGGTFDCAVLSGGDFTVVGQTSGDQNIGGELFDELLMNVIGERLDPAVWESIQVGQESVWLRVRLILRNEARKAKEALSTNRYVDVNVALPAGLAQVRLDRSDFEAIARPYLIETISQTEMCIADAHLRASDLSAIALVGGASRSPLVAELLASAFPGVNISRRGDPKASVAIGAALAPVQGRAPLEASFRVTQPASPGTAPESVRLAPPDAQPFAASAAEKPAPATPASPTPIRPPPTQFQPPVPPRPAHLLPETTSQPPPKNRKRMVLALIAVVGVIAIAAGVRAATDRSGNAGASVATTSDADTTDASTPGSSTPGSSTSGSSTSGSADTLTTANTAAAKNPQLPAASGTVGALLENLVGHTSLVAAATYSPDGLMLATGATDHTAKLWDLATGKVLWNLTEHTGDVQSVAFDSTGARLVTASSDGTARIWDVATGAALAVLEHDQTATYFSVNTAAFNSDGTRIVTASNDGTAKIWDTATGAELSSLPHDSFVYMANFSPDSTKIVTASLDDSAKIWDAATGALLWTLTGHTQGVESAAFSPDGTKVITGSEDNTAKIWDVATGALVTTLFGHIGTVVTASFSPDGTKILTASEDTTAKIWDVATGQALYSLAHASVVENARFTPDGSKLITISDYVGHIWNVADGALLADLADVVNDIAFSPDGQTLVTPTVDGSDSVSIWSLG